LNQNPKLVNKYRNLNVPGLKFKNITFQLYLFQVRGTSSLDFYVAEI